MTALCVTLDQAPVMLRTVHILHVTITRWKYLLQNWCSCSLFIFCWRSVSKIWRVLWWCWLIYRCKCYHHHYYHFYYLILTDEFTTANDWIHWSNKNLQYYDIGDLNIPLEECKAMCLADISCAGIVHKYGYQCKRFVS